jgi:hypothetical protein
VERHARGWVLWWLGCFSLWLVLVGDWSLVNGLAGAVAAAVAAAVAEAARTPAGVDVRVPAGTLRGAAGVPLAVVTDFGVLTAALARSAAQRRVVRGEYISREIDPGPKTTPAGQARRAWLALLAGYSPNAYLVDVDPEHGVALLHDLVPRRRSEEPA